MFGYNTQDLLLLGRKEPLPKTDMSTSPCVDTEDSVILGSIRLGIRKFKNRGNVRVKVTLRRVRVTIFAVENFMHFIF
jgi:hypothetical protein